ncbi:MAG: hypothetical protein UR28_C0002G0022 [Candidatus Peregrinibacteria bacterium GW2011_GWF2_33_10]|nr:MAG: hypothetical protein UR28_C0002G0022 [Candidatus Peregrinibacteria bacterium GW2011_GWF2_33_10]OGJ45603.1 MAG: hypothetical protein A2263_00680 [Candidatus Peregrinibacteria bacterium RIFOXYA2_FULL_33_21]OGJ46540.1 MAG: hypothetical protein A2272_03685 [Candidatus Peregrinibacteria bacterium RIFOXYA12_FULL_33_12]OGJ51068.1 MAG: hypothetical protein A2307_06330 [Candidatus Peregrinibacteria bacterium RIFOXYB2_FULL_33_20]
MKNIGERFPSITSRKQISQTPAELTWLRRLGRSITAPALLAVLASPSYLLADPSARTDDLQLAEYATLESLKLSAILAKINKISTVNSQNINDIISQLKPLKDLYDLDDARELEQYKEVIRENIQDSFYRALYAFAYHNSKNPELQILVNSCRYTRIDEVIATARQNQEIDGISSAQSTQQPRLPQNPAEAFKIFRIREFSAVQTVPQFARYIMWFSPNSDTFFHNFQAGIADLQPIEQAICYRVLIRGIEAFLGKSPEDGYYIVYFNGAGAYSDALSLVARLKNIHDQVEPNLSHHYLRNRNKE